MFTALLWFTTGTTRNNAEATMEYLRREGKPIRIEQFLEAAIRSERIFGIPGEPLPYNVPIQGPIMYNTKTMKANVGLTPGKSALLYILENYDLHPKNQGYLAHDKKTEYENV